VLDGDWIELNVDSRVLRFNVADDELSARRAA
jgi:dihydroxyacid dehydratase/phosphogluconate dehydratase